jgi:hypothetical protein
MLDFVRKTALLVMITVYVRKSVIITKNQGIIDD